MKLMQMDVLEWSWDSRCRVWFSYLFCACAKRWKPQHFRCKSITPLDCQLIDVAAVRNMGVKLPGLRILRATVLASVSFWLCVCVGAYVYVRTSQRYIRRMCVDKGLWFNVHNTWLINHCEKRRKTRLTLILQTLRSLVIASFPLFVHPSYWELSAFWSLDSWWPAVVWHCMVCMILHTHAVHAKMLNIHASHFPSFSPVWHTARSETPVPCSEYPVATELWHRHCGSLQKSVRE